MLLRRYGGSNPGQLSWPLNAIVEIIQKMLTTAKSIKDCHVIFVADSKTRKNKVEEARQSLQEGSNDFAVELSR